MIEMSAYRLKPFSTQGLIRNMDSFFFFFPTILFTICWSVQEERERVIDVFGPCELGSVTLPVVVMTAGSKRCGQQVSIHITYGLKHRNNMSTWIIVSFTPSLLSHCRNLRRRRGQQRRGDSETHGVRRRVWDGQRLAASRDQCLSLKWHVVAVGPQATCLTKKI